MLTPREGRFAKLATEQGLLTVDQIVALTGPKSEDRSKGNVLMLWDSAVLKKMVDAATAAKIMDDVGELDVEELGKFKLVRRLGRGGMGSVWLGIGPDNVKVAVKVLHPAFTNQQAFLNRFFREAETAVTLKHDHLVRGVEVGQTAGHYYFAMEFVEGRSVQSILTEEGALPPEKATAIILEVADALAYAHGRGMIHRDVKPDNILLTPEGHAKLADLGLARMTDEGATRLTEAGSAMGTPAYMPPEQCINARSADARSDIYALGATWYHMLVGRPPFEGASPMELMHKHQKEPLKWPSEAHGRLARGVVLTVERMMAKAPQNRIQSAQELIATIKSQCLGGRDIFKELGVDRQESAAIPTWHVQVRNGAEIQTSLLREDKLRELIRMGKIAPDTNVCLAGGHGIFIEVGKIKDFAGLFAGRGDSGKSAGRVARTPQVGDARKGTGSAVRVPAGSRGGSAYHNLVTHYSAYVQMSRKRRLALEALRRLKQLVILGAIIIVITVLVVYVLPQLKSAFSAPAKPAVEEKDP